MECILETYFPVRVHVTDCIKQKHHIIRAPLERPAVGAQGDAASVVVDGETGRRPQSAAVEGQRGRIERPRHEIPTGCVVSARIAAQTVFGVNTDRALVDRRGAGGGSGSGCIAGT